MTILRVASDIIDFDAEELPANKHSAQTDLMGYNKEHVSCGFTVGQSTRGGIINWTAPATGALWVHFNLLTCITSREYNTGLLAFRDASEKLLFALGVQAFGDNVLGAYRSAKCSFEDLIIPLAKISMSTVLQFDLKFDNGICEVYVNKEKLQNDFVSATPEKLTLNCGNWSGFGVMSELIVADIDTRDMSLIQLNVENTDGDMVLQNKTLKSKELNDTAALSFSDIHKNVGNREVLGVYTTVETTKLQYSKSKSLSVAVGDNAATFDLRTPVTKSFIAYENNAAAKWNIKNVNSLTTKITIK